MLQLFESKSITVAYYFVNVQNKFKSGKIFFYMYLKYYVDRIINYNLTREIFTLRSLEIPWWEICVFLKKILPGQLEKHKVLGRKMDREVLKKSFRLLFEVCKFIMLGNYNPGKFNFSDKSEIFWENLKIGQEIYKIFFFLILLFEA